MNLHIFLHYFHYNNLLIQFNIMINKNIMMIILHLHKLDNKLYFFHQLCLHILFNYQLFNLNKYKLIYIYYHFFSYKVMNHLIQNMMYHINNLMLCLIFLVLYIMMIKYKYIFLLQLFLQQYFNFNNNQLYNHLHKQNFQLFQNHYILINKQMYHLHNYQNMMSNTNIHQNLMMQVKLIYNLNNFNLLLMFN